MEIFLTLIQILTAIIAPMATIILAGLIIFRTKWHQHESLISDGICLRCSRSQKGAEGHFYYSIHKITSSEKQTSKNTEVDHIPILDSESHFVCNTCAYRHLCNEMLQHTLMVIVYPIYLFLVVPIFGGDGIFADFLIQTLLVVLSVAGSTSALNLYFAVSRMKDPLSEARDQVAIMERKNILGKNFSYYSRTKNQAHQN